MRVRALVTIQLARVFRAAGSVFEVESDVGTDLIARGIAEAVAADVESPETPRVRSLEEEQYVHLNAADAIEFIKGVKSLELLGYLAKIEVAREKPRVTVRRAFEERRDELYDLDGGDVGGQAIDGEQPPAGGEGEQTS